jgi:hypothetical protein
MSCRLNGVCNNWYGLDMHRELLYVRPRGAHKIYDSINDAENWRQALDIDLHGRPSATSATLYRYTSSPQITGTGQSLRAVSTDSRYLRVLMDVVCRITSRKRQSSTPAPSEKYEMRRIQVNYKNPKSKKNVASSSPTNCHRHQQANLSTKPPHTVPSIKMEDFFFPFHLTLVGDLTLWKVEREDEGLGPGGMQLECALERLWTPVDHTEVRI